MIDGAGKNILAFFDSLALSIAANGGTILINAAAAAVAAAEAQGGTGAEKFAAARASVVAALASQGIAAAMDAINGAIEAAVAQHNANLGLATAVAAPDAA